MAAATAATASATTVPVLEWEEHPDPAGDGREWIAVIPPGPAVATASFTAQVSEPPPGEGERWGWSVGFDGGKLGHVLIGGGALTRGMAEAACAHVARAVWPRPKPRRRRADAEKDVDAVWNGARAVAEGRPA